MALDEIFDYLVKKKAKNSSEVNELRNLKEIIWEIKEELGSAVRDLKPHQSLLERSREQKKEHQPGREQSSPR